MSVNILKNNGKRFLSFFVGGVALLSAFAEEAALLSAEGKLVVGSVTLNSTLVALLLIYTLIILQVTENHE